MDIEPLDPHFVTERLAQPPFVTIDGVYNVRDLGRLTETDDCVSSGSKSRNGVRPGFVYRSAEVSGITDAGRSQLRALGIRKIFDMRSRPEIAKWDSPMPSIDGVEILHTPVFNDEDYSPEAMAKRFELYSSGKTEAFMQLYTQLLEHAGPCFGTIMRHVRDRPDEPFLFHCTAGKDRTGILAALILRLAEVDDDTIALDYALTRIGREPCRAKIMARLTKEPLFSSNNQAALNMFTCRHETMLAFLMLLKGRYGDAEGYCRAYLGLTEGDISQIRRHLATVPDSVEATS